MSDPLEETLAAFHELAAELEERADAELLELLRERYAGAGRELVRELERELERDRRRALRELER